MFGTRATRPIVPLCEIRISPGLPMPFQTLFSATSLIFCAVSNSTWPSDMSAARMNAIPRSLGGLVRRLSYFTLRHYRGTLSWGWAAKALA